MTYQFKNSGIDYRNGEIPQHQEGNFDTAKVMFRTLPIKAFFSCKNHETGKFEDWVKTDANYALNTSTGKQKEFFDSKWVIPSRTTQQNIPQNVKRLSTDLQKPRRL